MDIDLLLFEMGLPKLVKSGNKWNARCIVCGDSKKSASKKRFWVLPSRSNANVFTCFCHNCGYEQSLKGFVNTFFPELNKKYFNRFKKRKEKKPTISISEASKKLIKQSKEMQINQEDISLTKIVKLPKSHSAHLYLDNRKMHKMWKKYLFYSDNFRKWVNTKIPNKFDYIPEYDKRIIIPFYTKDKKIFAIAGRTISNSKIRYLTIKFDEYHPKIFGLERVDFSKTVYILEGQFDSLFVPNSLAMGGSISNVSKLLEYAPIERFVLVPDIEPRNIEVCNFIEKSINMKFNISLMPLSLKKYGKDINKIIEKSNMSTREIYDIINQNIVSGLKAKIRFKSWKKVFNESKY